MYFAKELPVSEYLKQRKEHEDALVESTRSKPRTFFWPMTFEQIVIRNAVNREYGFLNI